MKIVYLAAGAAGMYCGSCMHDNRLAATLSAQGRDVVLIPLYTPLRTDETDVSRRRVFFGGINVYLQQSAALFRHTPWLLDRVFDARPLLNAVGRFASATQPEALGQMTVSVLKGRAGRQRKELDKLIAGLRHVRPSIVHLPNLMFVGVAQDIKAALGVPVVCTLAGEDIFLDRLPDPHRGEAFALIRQAAVAVDAFVALTDYYARHATEHFGLPAERVHRLPMGICTADFAQPNAPPERPFTIGFLAQVFPDKGLAELARAFIALREQGRACRLRAAGYLGPADRPYLEQVRTELAQVGGGGDFEYVGELNRAQKLDFLRSLHVLSVPTVYAESKGFYVLEALAAGVPVVEPEHGAFPELIEATGGGLLCEPGSAAALADALARLMDDASLRARLGNRGRTVVHSQFTAERMGDEAWKLYQQFG